MIDLKKIILAFGFVSIFLFTYKQLDAQAYNTSYKSRKPYFEIWGYPRTVRLNLVELEKGSPWHWGFSVGLNIFDFTQITPSGQTVSVDNQGNLILRADLSQEKVGFNINGIIDYRLLPNLNIRILPGIFFGSRQLNYYRQDAQSLLYSMPITSNYVEVPILLKYGALRFTNFRPYIIGGGNLRFNLNAKINEDAQRYVGLKKTEPFIELGFGFDFYLKYFRFSTEIKLSKGFKNALSNEIISGQEFYRTSLKSMQSNMISISFHFEG
ncbi:MAG: PorT family protein [Prevotellaceae bacterium]|jgi:hypothetical protein|nr:PorT family protein [Prevotellaceae bacterium]